MQIIIRDIRSKFYQIDDCFVDIYMKLVKPGGTAVYNVLCRHANKDQKCFPSKKTIAELSGISERNVYDSIKRLELWNIIKIEKVFVPGQYKNLIYTLLDKSQWRDKAVGKYCRRQKK